MAIAPESQFLLEGKSSLSITETDLVIYGNAQPFEPDADEYCGCGGLIDMGFSGAAPTKPSSTSNGESEPSHPIEPLVHIHSL